MLSRSELRNSAFHTAGIYLQTRLQGEIPALPRMTLAMYAAIHASFADDIKEIGARESFKRLDELSPLMISANDYCDIGLAAKRRRTQGCPQYQFPLLLHLENHLQYAVERDLEQITDSHTRSVAEIFLSDLTALSSCIRAIPQENFKEYLELDSALFETAAYASVVPDVVSSCGIDYEKKCRTYESIRDKYEFFLSTDVPTVTQKRVMANHNIEMILKVEDDIKGREIDSMLGVPNFLSYAEATGNAIPVLQMRYRESALYYGFPSITLGQIELLAGRSHDRKSLLAKNRSQPLNAEHLPEFFHKQYNTVLREELYYSGILDELFT